MRHEWSGQRVVIVVRCAGGLGNQLFQYAAGRRLAFRHSVPLRIDTSWYRGQALRSYALDRFAVQAEELSASEAEFVNRPFLASLPWKVVFRLSQAFWRRGSPLYLVENPLRFERRLLTAPAHCCLIGHWQDGRYFGDVAAIIRAELTLREPAGAQNEQLVRVIQQQPSVGVHVRRGDYVSEPEIARIHATCGLDYYERAFALARDVLGDVPFFVFSDDVPWVEKNFHLGARVTFVQHNGPSGAHNDLWLLSKCKHHIIANSTFSWWGAWLGAHSEQVVIAPQRWFGSVAKRTRDLCPGHWLRI